jgi:hypothetical protein
MTWENCRNYGFIQIQGSGSLQLYYDKNCFILVTKPNLYMTIESAYWQGNSVIVRGNNQYQEPLCYLIKSQFDYERLL